MITEIDSTDKDLNILRDFQGFFPDFLRKLWLSDGKRDWSIYSERSFPANWDFRDIERRGPYKK